MPILTQRYFTHMRLAAIDIGTNSVHMIVVQVRPDLSFEVIDREKEMVRLGAGGLDGRKLTDTAMDAALQALSKFRRLADSHSVDEILAAATSATREAENGAEFLASITDATGIRPRVISGTEEARLIHLAAVYGVDIKRGKAVVIDIGGGSVEITCGGEQAAARQELQARRHPADRAVRQERSAQRARRTAAGQTHPERDCRARQGDRARRLRPRHRHVGHHPEPGDDGRARDAGPGTGRDSQPADPSQANPSASREGVTLPLSQRLRMPGLEPRRADLVVAGSVLLDTILRALGADDITLCDLALREGLILDYVHRNRNDIARADRYPDVRRRSVIELAERCHYWPEHAQQVARVSLALFDQTRGIHGLTDRERQWLEYAALLHDIGVHISYEKHHRHSYYLMKHGDLRGFDPQEIEVMALVARYHRRATPKKGHPGYSELPAARRKA